MARDKKQPPRKRSAELEIQASFFRGLLARDPGSIEVMEELADVLLAQGLHQEVMALDQQLSELRPADPDVRYNLACSLTRNQEFERAATELSRAIELGFRDVDSLQSDPDLEDLRAHPAFGRVRACLRRFMAPPE